MGRSTVYNKGLTENWDNVNDKNKKLLKDFLTYCRASDRSSETISQYESNIKIFFCWCIENADNKFFVDLTKVDIMNFQGYLLHDLGHSPARVRTLRSGISSMANYIERMLDTQYPMFRNIVNKAVDAPVMEKVRDKLIMSEEQLNELLNKLVEDKKYQIACYVALGAFSGSRKSEILRFKVDYFKDEYIKNGLYITPEKMKTKGRGSRGKLLNKNTIASYFKPYLDLWLEERKELGIDSDYLFVINDKGVFKKAEVQNADYWAEVISKYINEPFYTHSLRHFYTTFLKKANIPDEVIKELVGWASTSMIQTYNDQDIMDDIGKFFSTDGIVKQDKQETKF